MFTLLRNYRTLFMNTVMSSFGEGAVHKADTNSDGELNAQEYNTLSNRDKSKVRSLLRSKGQWEDFKATWKLKYEEKVKAQADVTHTANVEQKAHRKVVSKSPRVLKIAQDGSTYTESNEVTSGNVEALQALVGTTVDGKWGPNSQKTLNAYLKKGKSAVQDVQRIIGTTADGAFGPNSKAALAAFIAGGSAEGGYSETGREVISQLKDIQEYLDAYNRVYGENSDNGKVKLFSNNKGLLGIANQIASPNYKKLAGELGVTNDQVKEITGDSGINKAGLTRFATIAVISAFASGGTSLALELFGINVGKDFHKGPEVQKILKLMKSTGNLHASMNKLIISEETTAKDLTGTVDQLNNPAFTNTLRRHIKDIFKNSVYAGITGGLKDYRDAKKLVDQFENTNDTEGAKQILLAIYEIGLKRLKRAERVVPGHKSRINELEQALRGIGIESGRMARLDAKYDKIVGTDTRAERAATANAVAAESGYTGKLKSISASKLDSQNAYGFKLPKNPSEAQLSKILASMESTKVQGDKHSILTHVVTGIRTHANIHMSVADFKEGFSSMRSLSAKEMAAIDKNILSNTGRKLSESFQGKVSSDNITAMEVNGSTIYFRGECTNVLTINEPIDVTITSAKSIPVAIPVSIGGGNAVTAPEAPEGEVTTTPTTSGVWPINAPTVPPVAAPGTTVTTGSNVGLNIPG